MENSASLLFGAAVLGFRHGIDWDHIAAITDITSSSRALNALRGEARHTLALSSMYAVGHATVVAALGLCALSFAAFLPDWIDPVMERIVGLTLLLLGSWVVVALIQYLRGKQSYQPKSRWMLLGDLISRARKWLRFKLTGSQNSRETVVTAYGFRTAFAIGVIHGIGAETGTQVLLIAAIGGANCHGLGTAMLFSFLAGLLVSNTVVALLSIVGFDSSKRAKPLFVAASVLTCCFSLVVGSYFVFGCEDQLPSLDTLLGHARG
jgi:high-affinity nickel permease